MSPAVPGSSPLIPARPFHPCLASRVSLEFGLRLCSAVSLLLLGRAVPTLKAWPSSTAGAGSFSITPGLTQHPRHCPTEHPRLPPEGLATKQGSTSTSVEIPPWQHLSCSSVLQWALTTRTPPALSLCVSYLLRSKPLVFLPSLCSQPCCQRSLCPDSCSPRRPRQSTAAARSQE